jgi:hypothetical protein
MTPQHKPAFSVGQLQILHVNKCLEKIGEGLLHACISSTVIPLLGKHCFQDMYHKGEQTRIQNIVSTTKITLNRKLNMFLKLLGL